MSGWYKKIAFVELSKLAPLTNTIKIWLDQAKNSIDESKVQDSIMDVFPVIDDPITLQSAIANAQNMVAAKQGGFLTATQATLVNLLTQRIQDFANNPAARSSVVLRNVNKTNTPPVDSMPKLSPELASAADKLVPETDQ